MCCTCFLIVPNFVFSFFFFQAEDGIRDADVTGVQTCALPIFRVLRLHSARSLLNRLDLPAEVLRSARSRCAERSEEHTSELQSRPHLVCRLLLEKKKTTTLCLFLLSKKKKKT